MFDRARLSLSALMIVSLCVAGCGEEQSADPAYDEGSAPAAAEGDAGTAEGETIDDAPPADADADAQQPSKPAVATPDVPVPAGVKDEEVIRHGWVSYSAAQKPAELAAFYQKELTAKGWTLGRNDAKPMAGTTLTGVVQEYRKGSDVLSVCLTEQIASEGALTMVVVMDIPLPPKTTQIVAFGNQAIIQTPQTPDEVIAFFTKHLAPLGWTSKSTSEAGVTKSVGFAKGNRTLSTQVRPGSGQKGTSLTLMHIAYAD